jgi:sugar lactone lactonase YvrE
MTTTIFKASALATVLFIASVCSDSDAATTQRGKINIVATSEQQWTGVAVEKSGGLFVNYPRWSDKVPVSVAHFPPDSDLHPFPDAKWNSWKAGDDPTNKFVCVQAVYITPDQHLWVVDAGSPKMGGVVPGAAKLLEFHPKNGKLLRAFRFDKSIAPPKSYLNDVRFDKQMRHAFITDSGIGAIIVVDLQTGKARRLLENSATTKSQSIGVEIDGKVWKRDGKLPDINADGIAIDPTGQYLYFDALTAITLYRIKVSDLLNEKLDEKTLNAKVEWLVEVGPNDGLEFGPDGFLYITSLPSKAITRWKPEMKKPEIYVQDARLIWPDSLSNGPNGKMYVSISRIHEGDKPLGPYDVYQFDVRGK